VGAEAVAVALGFIVRAFDYDCVLVFEDDSLNTLVEALAGLERVLTMWFNEKEIKVPARERRSTRFRRNS